MGVMPTHFVFNYNKTLRRNFAESFIQNSSFVLKLPIFQKHNFFKNSPKNLPKAEKLIFFCIHGNYFIGLFNGILHDLLLLVYPEKLKPLLLLNFIRHPLYAIPKVAKTSLANTNDKVSINRKPDKLMVHFLL